MKRTIKTSLLFVLLAACMAGMSCGNDDNPLAPSSLAGTWKLVTFTNKTDNFTATAGQPVDVGGGVIVTVTGTSVLTETRYDFTITQITEIPGLPSQTDEFKSAGTYSVNGSTMTATDDGTGEVTTFTMSRSGNRLTLENAESKTVWDKQ
ncbi:MAG: lipocalin family protein [bacterium]